MLIRGGTVVTASGQVRADVLVEGERIARVEPEILGGEPVLDASGLLVLPGMVDPHTHFILDTGSARTADDFESASRAAAGPPSKRPPHSFSGGSGGMAKPT